MTEINKMLSPGDAAQHTGLSTEVLRKWEQRFGFPVARRTPQGRRMLLASDLPRLQLLARGLRLGWRVSDLMPLSLPELEQLPNRRTRASNPPNQRDALAAQVLDLLATPDGLERLPAWLDQHIRNWGLGPFCTEVLPRLHQGVGLAWHQGQLAIHQEHAFSQTVETVLRHRLLQVPQRHRPPAVVLATPRGELHGQGLLALLVLLRLAGAHAVDLGTNLPEAEVAAACRLHRAAILALSISSAASAPQVRKQIRTLLALLPPDTQIWVGGQGSQALRLLQEPRLSLFVTTQAAAQRWQEWAQALQKPLENPSKPP